MQVTVKLFALLSRYLPPGARDNQVLLEVPDAATPDLIIAQLAIPHGQCHLLLVNGVYIPPGAREQYVLQPGDVLALWPPVAGG